MKPIIYMDNCCYNRPFDDQQHFVIKLETEAKLQIQHEVLQGRYSLVWSFILYYENDKNPFGDRKTQIAQWESVARLIVTNESDVRELAKSIMGFGIGAKDALHLACAIHANAGSCPGFVVCRGGIPAARICSGGSAGVNDAHSRKCPYDAQNNIFGTLPKRRLFHYYRQEAAKQTNKRHRNSQSN